MLNVTTNNLINLSEFTKTAQKLTQQINQTLTFDQLSQIIKQTSEHYYLITQYLLNVENNETKDLIDLCKQFSQIETQALLRYHNGSYMGCKSLL
jgi:hypothetical protein